MNKIEFKKAFNKTISLFGFKKKGSLFYLSGNKNVICVLELQHSNYGAYYYINCGMYLEDHYEKGATPSIGDCEIHTSRIKIKYREETPISGPKNTDAFYYEFLTYEELAAALESFYQYAIKPAIGEGLDYILNNLVTWENDKKTGGIYTANLRWICGQQKQENSYG